MQSITHNKSLRKVLLLDMSVSSPRNVKRRANFQVLVNTWGGVNEVSRLIASPASHVSAVLAGNAGIGDKLTGKIERVFNLQPGALDVDPNSFSPIPEIDGISQVLSRMYRANRVSREEVASMLQTLQAREKLSTN